MPQVSRVTDPLSGFFRESSAIAPGGLFGDNWKTGANKMSSTPDTSIRGKVTEAIKTLPDDASWDDVMYRIYVRQKIENGLKDVTDGNTVTVSDVRKRFGLPE
jgi:hypothetical protein